VHASVAEVAERNGRSMRTIREWCVADFLLARPTRLVHQRLTSPALHPRQRPSATLLVSFDSATSLAESTTIWNAQSGLKQPAGMAAMTSTGVPAGIIGVFTVTGVTVLPVVKLTVVCEGPAGPAP
jgi:hypothetical protein